MAKTTRKPRTKKVKEARPTYKTRVARKKIVFPQYRMKYPNGRWTTTRATDAIIETDHQYIHKVPGVIGGEPVIKGTRIAVRDVFECWKLGWTLQRILKAYPHLRLAEVCDALGYYDDHQQEILDYIEENELIEVKK